MVEDMQRQASDMEKEVKDMMELEGRAIGIELDKRKNARELFNELMEHQNAQVESQAMTWAYVPCDMCDDANVYLSESIIHDYHHDDGEADVHHDEVHHEAPQGEAPADPEGNDA